MDLVENKKEKPHNGKTIFLIR